MELLGRWQARWPVPCSAGSGGFDGGFDTGSGGGASGFGPGGAPAGTAATQALLPVLHMRLLLLRLVNEEAAGWGAASNRVQTIGGRDRPQVWLVSINMGIRARCM